MFLLCSAANAADGQARTWKVDGVERTALVYAPSSAQNEPSPVLFVFHGHGGKAAYVAKNARFDQLWPNALIVYMQGLPTPGRLTDPKGALPGWQARQGDQGDRDLHFFDAVLASLRKDYKIDESRIYATGHSNGGLFTYLLWASRGDLFAALAPSGAIAFTRGVTLKPKPILHVAGKNDELVKFAWQEMTMQAVRKINHCADHGVPWAKAGDITATLYPSSPQGTPFVSAIYPGSHMPPSEASGLIVKFLKEQTRPAH